MDSAWCIDVLTDRSPEEGGPEKRTYAVSAESPQEALRLAQAELPASWTVSVAPPEWKFGLAVVRDFDVRPGVVRRIT